MRKPKPRERRHMATKWWIPNTGPGILDFRAKSHTILCYIVNTCATYFPSTFRSDWGKASGGQLSCALNMPWVNGWMSECKSNSQYETLDYLEDLLWNMWLMHPACVPLHFAAKIDSNIYKVPWVLSSCENCIMHPHCPCGGSHHSSSCWTPRCFRWVHLSLSYWSPTISLLLFSLM